MKTPADRIVDVRSLADGIVDVRSLACPDETKYGIRMAKQFNKTNTSCIQIMMSFLSFSASGMLNECGVDLRRAA